MNRNSAFLLTGSSAIVGICIGGFVAMGLFAHSEEPTASLATRQDVPIRPEIPIPAITGHVEAEQSKRELASIRAELAELRSKLSSLSLPVGTGLNKPYAATDSIESNAVLSPEEAGDADQSTHQQPADITARFEKEAVDPAWSARATDAIYRAVQEGAFQSISVRQIECRSTICRAEIEHLDAEERQAFLQQLPAMMGHTFREFSAQYSIDESGGFVSLELDAGDLR